MMRRIVRYASFGALVALAIMGRAQLWIVLFLAATIAVVAFSRLYCGWLCPINTVLQTVPGKHGRASGEVRHGNLIRAASVLLLIAGIISTAAFGMGLPLLPAIVIIGIVVGLYDERLFHSYLCPFGNIQRLMPGLGGRMTVDGEACVSCGACVRACPMAAIGLGDKAIIDQRECIS